MDAFAKAKDNTNRIELGKSSGKTGHYGHDRPPDKSPGHNDFGPEFVTQNPARNLA